MLGWERAECTGGWLRGDFSMNVCLASSETGGVCLVRAVWQSKRGPPRSLVPAVGEMCLHG